LGSLNWGQTPKTDRGKPFIDAGFQAIFQKWHDFDQNLEFGIWNIKFNLFLLFIFIILKLVKKVSKLIFS